jgi:hypothetical protein
MKSVCVRLPRDPNVEIEISELRMKGADRGGKLGSTIHRTEGWRVHEPFHKAVRGVPLLSPNCSRV